MENKICLHCGKSLSESIYKTASDGTQYKSCPNCSQLNGEYHVLHQYPQNFGTTYKRATSVHPEGPQSHCESCRGGNPPSGGTLCTNI